MNVLSLGSVRVDFERCAVERGETRLLLTTLEAAVLRYLLSAGRTVSRDELLAKVWGYSEQSLSRAADTTVRRLRAKIEDDPSNPELILTVHGTGYRLVLHGPPDAQPPAVSDPPLPSRRYHFGTRTLDLDRQRIEDGEQQIALSGREVEVVAALLAAGGASLSRDVLQRKIWGTSLGRALESMVLRIRRKLEPDPSKPRFLLTTANGYRIEPSELPPNEAVTSPPSFSLPPLPAELDRCFGRERELSSVIQQFSGGARAITLLGPGGIGKSRLALAAGRTLAEGGAQVAFVPSSRARDRASFCVMTAHALQLQLSNDDPSGTLRRFLAAESNLWLLLDNLEQIEGAAEEISEWLAAAPTLHVLATSRVRLHIRGAHDLVVPPLCDADATELFADRADRPIRPNEQDDVLALVRAFDGLPLAIELAAARTRALSIAQIRSQLTSSLALLSRGQGEEHRSVRSSLDASLAIAALSTRTALAQLSVFEGSFSVEAAMAILDLSQVAPGIWPIDVLQEMCDASLLRFDGDQGRYSLLRVVRQYAAELLSEGVSAGVWNRVGGGAVRG
ncbi:MAG: winged helix-turn-helix domain-containing protein [Myxococcota bacterium]